MRDRLEWSDVKLLHSILIFVDTQGWQAKSNSTDTGVSDCEDETDTLEEIKLAVDYIISAFRAPLETKGMN